MLTISDDKDQLPKGTPYSNEIRSVAFDTFFTLEHSIPLTSFGGLQLNRECSLFSEDGDFVIIGSAQVPYYYNTPIIMKHNL